MNPNDCPRGESGSPEGCAALFGEIVRTREFRRFLGLLIPELLDLWAEDSPLKRKLTAPVSAGIRRGAQQTAKDPAVGTLQNPDDLRRIFCQIPGLMSAFQSGLDALLATIEKMAPSQQEELLNILLAPPGNGDVRSGLAGRGAKMLAELHRRNPRLLTDALAPLLRHWYASTDFGELRDFLDGSREDIAAFAVMINDVLWQYPAKFVLLLSFLPDIFNGVVCLAKETVGRLNQTSPDLVSDIVLSLFREIDARELGKLVNETLELFRKLHTGSALIGDSGLPLFPHDLHKALAAAGAEVEPEAVSRAVKALAEERGEISGIWTGFLDGHPELWKRIIENYGAAGNVRMRSLRKRMEALDAHPDDDGLVDAAAKGLSEIDTQEIAEIVNLSAALARRLRDTRPELLGALARQLTDSLDYEAIGDAAAWLTAELGDDLISAGRAALPHLLQGLCRVMAPADDAFEDAMKSARENLRIILLGQEARP
jgi:hypothetical protein